MSKRKTPDGGFRVVDDDDPEWVVHAHDEQWAVYYETVLAAHAEVSARTAICVRIVRCVPAGGCGGDGKAGERLAEVWRTSHGNLWLSGLIVAHDAVPTFREIHPDAIVMEHPSGGVVETTRRAFDAVWREKGWRVSRRPPPRRWRSQHRQIVRDLVDREDLPHVSLRVKCSVHGGPVVVDRQALLHELDRPAARRGHAVSLQALFHPLG